MTVLKRGLTVEDIEVRLYAEAEEVSAFDSQMSVFGYHSWYDYHGSSEKEREEAQAYADTVQCVLSNSPDWGWCVVVVEVSFGPFKAEQSMGNCSYKSADDFKENSGYYMSMVEEALEDLNTEIEMTVNDLYDKGCI